MGVLFCFFVFVFNVFNFSLRIVLGFYFCSHILIIPATWNLQYPQGTNYIINFVVNDCPVTEVYSSMELLLTVTDILTAQSVWSYHQSQRD